MYHRLKILVLMFGSSVVLCGCGRSIPEVVQAGGVVKIDGEPLPRAVVSFVPMAEGLDGSHIATGISDENGRFTLSFFSGSGVYAGLNKVTIRDESAPEGGRAMTDEGARIRQEHKQKLSNRPIPSEYLSVGQTPLSFEVTPDKKEYVIDIKR